MCCSSAGEKSRTNSNVLRNPLNFFVVRFALRPATLREMLSAQERFHAKAQSHTEDILKSNNYSKILSSKKLKRRLK